MQVEGLKSAVLLIDLKVGAKLRLSKGINMVKLCMYYNGSWVSNASTFVV